MQYLGNKIGYTRWKNLQGFLFVIPALVFIAIFLLYPIVTAARLSFSRYTLLSSPEYIGLENYRSIIHSESFVNSLRVTGMYTLIRVSLLIILGLLLALLINRTFPLRDLVQSLYFAPYIMPLAVASIIWKLIYHPWGLMEQFTSHFINQSIPWLTTSKFAMTAVLISTIWSGVGYYMVLFLVGLQTIPKEYCEAANIDGATTWKSFVYITLPLLKPTMLFVTIIAVINTMKGFPPFLVMTGGGPGEATRVIGLLVYETSFRYFRMGLACAMSVIFLVLIMIFTLIQIRIHRFQVGV